MDCLEYSVHQGRLSITVPLPTAQALRKMGLAVLHIETRQQLVSNVFHYKKYRSSFSQQPSVTQLLVMYNK